MVEVKAGVRLRSVVGNTEVIVIRSQTSPLDLRSGGVPMVPAGLGNENSAENPREGFEGEVQIGERYWNEEKELEVLVTRAGAGALSVGDALLSRKAPKRLPSSD